MSVSLRENITAVIETCFSETKEEIQDTAISRILELIRADRKTENSSEKPNNCEPKICDTCRYYNSNIPCGSTPSACKEADKFAEKFVDGLKKLKPKDEPQTDCLEQFRVGLEYHTDTTHFGKAKGESVTTNKIEDEPQTELVNDSQILVKDLVDDEFNPYDEECMRCKHLKLKCEFVPSYCKYEPRDEQGGKE